MEEITIKACGKINLGIDVVGHRGDGYHLVRMVMQSVSLADNVTLRKINGKLGLSLTCDDPAVPQGKDNIAFKAAEGLMKKYPIFSGLEIHIEKHIPMEAGMAGGSTDAAAVILGMKELFGLRISEWEMDVMAAKLGADVPFCLRRGTYLAEGIGDILTRLPNAPQCHAVIVNPDIKVSTKTVYNRYEAVENPVRPDIDSLIREIRFSSLKGMALYMGNVLEHVTERDNSIITDIKARLKKLGATAALMTGSGPTVFGLFLEEEKAAEAFEKIKKEKFGKCYITTFEY